MNFGRLQARFDAFGFDLDSTTRDELLNEGHVELCVQSEWTRRTVELGPTAADDESYDLGEEIQRLLRLKLDGRPVDQASEEEVDRIKTGTLLYRNYVGSSIYWLSQDDDGVESVNLYPTPTTAGLSIAARAVVRPAALEDESDEPIPPSNFHVAIIDYAVAQTFQSDEDDADMRAFHQAQFENKVAELKALRLVRAGRSPRQIRVRGRTAA